ncbi:MAG: M48 family metalloprotease [Armatimonadota bacterium]
MTKNPEIFDDLPADLQTEAELGEWLHTYLTGEYGNETEAWATERVCRISRRLNEVRAACPIRGVCPHDLQVEILWIGAMNAFALPGSYVYITRELLQQADADEPFALVIAHEMAHHDLGHTRILRGSLSQIRHASAFVVGAFLNCMGRRFIGPENESAADSYALDLCIAAGYDGKRCLELYTILEAYAVDHRDLDGVFGTDESLTNIPPGEFRDVRAWLQSVRGWTWQRLRGYPSLRERRTSLTVQLNEYGA